MDSSRNYYGGGGGGRHYGGGGRQRHRGRGGRGGRFRHQPYNPNRRPRGGRGNRFGGHTQSVDPQTMMLRQVSSFVSRVGEFKNLRASEHNDLRSVEYTTAMNINDLTSVLCAQDKVEALLKFSALESAKPQDKVGQLVHMVVGCASSLPMQTPGYAALTLSVHEKVKGTPYDGFGRRCVDYAMLHFARDLDSILLSSSTADAHQAACRCKLLLRYLASLGKLGMVQVHDGQESSNVDPSKFTLMGLVSKMAESAKAAMEQHKNQTAVAVLCILVLNTAPYLMEVTSRDLVEQALLQPIEALLKLYKSSYTPGVGTHALLLKDPQAEDDEEEDDEEEDDDEEEEEEGGQVCDTLQDLLRAAQKWRKEGEATRFCLPVDAPWKSLVQPQVQPPSEGDVSTPETQAVAFSQEPFYLSFTQECQAMLLLLGGEVGDIKLQCFRLDGIVFGRLPIFGAPHDPDDDGDDDDDMEETSSKNEELTFFTKGFSFLDRFFVADTIRDCLICHQSHVSKAGVQQGSAKIAAEELLSIGHSLSGENASSGLGYAICEVVFALISQSSQYSPLRHTFLSRVLLELTKLEPSKMSAALALAVTNIFQDYIPALVPVARENISRWFAYHLIHTDYQWPSAFWQAWEPYVTSDKVLSRGSFVKRVLHLMGENVAEPVSIASQCFSGNPALAAELIDKRTKLMALVSDESEISSIASQLYQRIWDDGADAALVQDFIVGDEFTSGLGEVNGSDLAKLFPRSQELIRTLLYPAKQMRRDFSDALEDLVSPKDNMIGDGTGAKDVQSTISDYIAKYSPALKAAIAKDTEEALAGGSIVDPAEGMVLGEASVLRISERFTCFHCSLLNAVVMRLLDSSIVSERAVLKWCLGDFGDSATWVVPRWENYAIEVLGKTLSTLGMGADSNGGMVIDNSGVESDETLVSKSIAHVADTLHYAIKRVCEVLVSEQADSKHLAQSHVELLEGLKQLLYGTKTALITSLTNSHGTFQGVSYDRLAEMIEQSSMSGRELSTLCTGQKNSAVIGLLKRSVGGM